jgi:CARDB protein
MRRLIAAFVVAGAAFAASVAGGFAATPVHKPSASSVTVAACHPSDDVTQRFASFNGQMHTIPGTQRMAMHFTLLERIGHGLAPFKPVALPDLKPWRRSKPGARTFIYTQRVTALRDGDSYRMRVQFRWYGANKTVLRTTTLRSRSCRQPAPLPNLTVTSITSAPATTSGQRVYSITVGNSGQGDASNVPVALKIDGQTVGSARIDLLPSQESSVVQIQGPACAFSVRAVADPDRVIPETNDSDNGLTVPCSQVGP